MPTAARRSSHRLMFVAFCAVFLAIATGYVFRARTLSTAPAPTAPAAAIPVADSLTVLDNRPGFLFTSTAFDRTNGFLGLASMSGSGPDRYETTLRCERVHFARGVGVCLTGERKAITTFSASLFGPDFRIRHTVPLAGTPSRARMSPDGRRAAVTVFVSGDSYNSGGFSTRTTLIDVATGHVIADLETFAITKAGSRFKAIDFNFWGVTFARDGNRFFATLRSGSTNYLVEGDVDARTARVLREGVECPSLSPDNTRIVFKSRVSASTWRLHLLDLATLRDTPLTETRNVDDQAEWLDDESIAYGLPSEPIAAAGGDIWTLAVNGQTPPRALARKAYSPAVIH
jgi:hypothetical protein